MSAHEPTESTQKRLMQPPAPRFVPHTRRDGGGHHCRPVASALFASKTSSGVLDESRASTLPPDKRADIHEALSLGCALICRQALRKTWTKG